jgi:hypothetical protein
MTVEGGAATAVVGAPADPVWELVTDVTRTGEWRRENTGAVWLDGATGPAVGARFSGTNRRGKTKWASTCEVIGAVSRFVTRISTGVRDRRADLEDNVRHSRARIKEILETGTGPSSVSTGWLVGRARPGCRPGPARGSGGRRGR